MLSVDFCYQSTFPEKMSLSINFSDETIVIDQLLCDNVFIERIFLENLIIDLVFHKKYCYRLLFP